VKRFLFVIVALVAASCSQSSQPGSTTSAVPPVQETGTSTTTTTLSPTTSASTTTTPLATTSTLSSFADLADIVFPDDPQTVNDLPDALTARIGAPIPDPDLTLEGPEDVDRWLTEWLSWAASIQANPTDDADVLSDGLLAGTEIIEEWQAALAGRVAQGERFLGFAFIPTGIVLTTFDEDFREGKLFTLVVNASSPYPGYTVDEGGSVVDILPAQEFSVPLELTLRPNGGGEWVVSNLAPISS